MAAIASRTRRSWTSGISNPPDVALTVIRIANTPATSKGVLTQGTTMPVADELPWSIATEAVDEPAVDGPRTVYAQWGDGQGHWSGVSSAAITLDMTGPTMAPPTAPRLSTGAIVGSPPAVPVTVSWPAATDALSGVEEYEVQVTAGPVDAEEDWVGFGQPTTGRSLTDDLPPGQTYHFRVRAYDRVGNVSDWQVGPAAKLSLIDDASVAIQYSSGWSSHRSPGALRGTYHSTSSAGATATVRFSGRSVAIAASIGPGHGALDVSIDGRFVRRVVLTAPANLSRRVVFAQTLRAGIHTRDRHGRRGNARAGRPGRGAHAAVAEEANWVRPGASGAVSAGIPAGDRLTSRSSNGLRSETDDDRVGGRTPRSNRR